MLNKTKRFSFPCKHQANVMDLTLSRGTRKFIQLSLPKERAVHDLRLTDATPANPIQNRAKHLLPIRAARTGGGFGWNRRCGKCKLSPFWGQSAKLTGNRWPSSQFVLWRGLRSPYLTPAARINSIMKSRQRGGSLSLCSGVSAFQRSSTTKLNQPVGKTRGTHHRRRGKVYCGVQLLPSLSVIRGL